MRLLVTGADGYIGCVIAPMLRRAGHEVVGLDTNLFGDCSLGEYATDPDCISMDVRDVDAGDLEGFDAILHLAAVSNDPIGDLHPHTTYQINYLATVRLALLAKQAGVERFLFSSSCSLYGAGPDGVLDETAPFNPVTPYGESKVLAEAGLSKLADDNFSPTYLRNGTAYGLSQRMRGDLVVNNLVGLACTTGRVTLNSDGAAWRPLVHVEDISRAFLAVLDAPREDVHDEAFNVGKDDGNYRIREVAKIVAESVPGSTLAFANGAGADKRSYRVGFGKITETLPAFEPQWTVEPAAAEMRDAYWAEELGPDDFVSSRFMRIKRVRELIDDGTIDSSLRYRSRRFGRRLRMAGGVGVAPAPRD